VLAAGAACGVAVTRVGAIEAYAAKDQGNADAADDAGAAPRLRFADAAGAPLALDLAGFDHFKS